MICVVKKLLRVFLTASVFVTISISVLASGDAFAQNRNGIFRLTDLTVEILQEGSGPASQTGQTIVVDFTSWIVEDGRLGRVFDSADARGGPWTFVLGANRVMQGWNVGLSGIKEGAKVRLTVPPQMAYGARGFAGPSAFVPPDSWVISEISLLEIR